VTSRNQWVGHIVPQTFTRKREAISYAKRLQVENDGRGNSSGEYLEVRNHAGEVVFETTPEWFWAAARR
jgi:hypothetical protein